MIVRHFLRELADTAVDTFDIAWDTVVRFLREIGELGEAPDRTRQGLVAALALMLATFLALLLEIQSPWWAAISAFMSLTATGGGSLRRGLLRFSGTAAGALLGFVMARWLPYVAPTTDWIRLQRRIPVTIVLDEPPPDGKLYMGADARTVVFPRW